MCDCKMYSLVSVLIQIYALCHVRAAEEFENEPDVASSAYNIHHAYPHASLYYVSKFYRYMTRLTIQVNIKVFSLFVRYENVIFF